jgi:hypothetical protein
MTKKEYKGSVYIGVVGNETENGQCRDSIENIQRRKTDTPPIFVRATKGYEARQMHLNNWYENTKHPFMLLLDHDMIFPQNTLEQLRKHKLPFVSGFYMRRTFNPVAPVWFENGKAGEMPMKPFTFVPEKDRLYPLGASGWGCILIHRDVVTATRKILKGEPEIIEDDMDIAPYDMQKVLKAIKGMKSEIDKEAIDLNKIKAGINLLDSEIVPLRMVKDPVGSDIRFPFFAKLAGFQLWGDSGINCGHLVNYPIKMDDYLNQPAHVVRSLSVAMHESNSNEINRLQKARKA